MAKGYKVKVLCFYNALDCTHSRLVLKKTNKNTLPIYLTKQAGACSGKGLRRSKS